MSGSYLLINSLLERIDILEKAIKDGMDIIDDSFIDSTVEHILQLNWKNNCKALFANTTDNQNVLQQILQNSDLSLEDKRKELINHGEKLLCSISQELEKLNENHRCEPAIGLDEFRIALALASIKQKKG